MFRSRTSSTLQPQTVGRPNSQEATEDLVLEEGSAANNEVNPPPARMQFFVCCNEPTTATPVETTEVIQGDSLFGLLHEEAPVTEATPRANTAQTLGSHASEVTASDDLPRSGTQSGQGGVDATLAQDQNVDTTEAEADPNSCCSCNFKCMDDCLDLVLFLVLFPFFLINTVLCFGFYGACCCDLVCVSAEYDDHGAPTGRTKFNCPSCSCRWLPRNNSDTLLGSLIAPLRWCLCSICYGACCCDRLCLKIQYDGKGEPNGKTKCSCPFMPLSLKTCVCQCLPTSLQVRWCRLRMRWMYTIGNLNIWSWIPPKDAWSDPKFVLLACTRHGFAFDHVDKTADMWKDKDFVLAMVKIRGKSVIQYVNANLWKDKSFVIAMVKSDGKIFESADANLKSDKSVVMQVVKISGKALEHAAEPLKKDRDVVCAAISEWGNSLQYASEELRKEKAVVLAAVRKEPAALKYALGGLNQDQDCLKASGIWDEQMVAYSRPEQAILSVKFSLAETSTPYATEFALAIKKDPYFRAFQTYNPNAWSKKSCDPNTTDIQHKCRGTSNTCLYPEHQNLSPEKRPTESSCWRFAYRFHQEECKATNGFMIQVQESNGLGAGQKIESEMAAQVGLKVFRTTTHWSTFYPKELPKLTRAVKAWYESGCEDMNMDILSF